MKLTELFPELIKIKIQNKEYELKFNTRAVLQMEKDYPDVKDREALISMAGVDKKKQPIIAIKDTQALIDLLYAGLLHTKAFADKDTLTDAIEPRDFGDYTNAVFAAFMQAKLTPEQMEKLEVMDQVNPSKKNIAGETTPASTHSTK